MNGQTDKKGKSASLKAQATARRARWERKRMFEASRHLSWEVCGDFCYSIIISFPQQMRANMMQVLLLVGLIGVGLCTNWTASGNFTADNITYIKNVIDDVLHNIATGGIPERSIAFSISDFLNTAWEPAWNVVVLKLKDPLLDTVLYGYAFRNHWIWFNNYGTDQRAYIIWKDYNCVSWADVDLTNMNIPEMASYAWTVIDNAMNEVIAADTLAVAALIDDPWRMAHETVDKVNSEPTRAVSMVMSPSQAIFYAARICTTVIDGKNQFAYTLYRDQSVDKAYSFLTFYTR